METLPRGPAHNSMLNTVKRCPQKYVYKYVWGFRKLTTSLPLTRGLWLHSMLQAEALRKGIEKGSLLEIPYLIDVPGLEAEIELDHDNLELVRRSPALDVDTGLQTIAVDRWPLTAGGMLKLLTEEVYDNLPDEIHEDLVQDGVTLPEACKRIMRSYLWAYRTSLADEDPLLVEYEFETEVDGHLYHGRIDLLFRDKDGRIVLRDWKTSSSMPEGSVWKLTESQLHLYPVALEPHFPEHTADAVEFDFLLTKPPGQPATLKSGKLSRATKLMDPLSLKQAADAAGIGLDDEIYATDKKNPTSPTLREKIEELTDSSPFYRRYRMPRSKKVTATIFEDNAKAIEFMDALHEDTSGAYRVTDRSCDYMCEFKDVCVAHLYDLDYGSVLNRDFEPWEPDDLHDLNPGDDA